MASTLVKVSSTNHSIKYRWDTDVPGGAAAIVKAQLVLDAEQGPLRELLSGVYSDVDWSALPAGKELQILFTPDTVTITGPTFAQFSIGIGPVQQLQVGQAVATVGGGIVELRYVNSMVR